MRNIYSHKISTWIYISRWENKKNLWRLIFADFLENSEKSPKDYPWENINHVKNIIRKKMISLVSGSKAMC